MAIDAAVSPHRDGIAQSRFYRWLALSSWSESYSGHLARKSNLRLSAMTHRLTAAAPVMFKRCAPHQLLHKVQSFSSFCTRRSVKTTTE